MSEIWHLICTLLGTAVKNHCLFNKQTCLVTDPNWIILKTIRLTRGLLLNCLIENWNFTDILLHTSLQGHP